MNAGRKLDALVAEKVMGWTDVTPRRHADGSWSGVRHDWPMPVIDDILHYSTDIAAAWQVVERMRGDFELDLSDHVLFWTARFTKMHAPMRRVIEAPTAPLAICHAALAALEVDK